MTNADRLNAMTIEEKAVFFANLQSTLFEIVKKEFHIPIESVELDKSAVIQEMLDWLKQEIQE